MALRPNVTKLKDVLLKAGVVDEFQMRSALGRLEQWGGRLTGVLVDMGLVDDETLINALANAFRLPVMHLGLVTKDSMLLSKVDIGFCEEHALFPVSLRDRVATIAVSDPTQLDPIDTLQKRLGARVQMVISPEPEIRAAIAKHYRGQDIASNKQPRNNAREAHIAATKGEAFELDLSEPPSADGSSREAFMKKAPSANTMLDEFMDDEAPKSAELTDEELKRLGEVQKNQARTSAILRALQELLAEKGVR